MLRYGLNVDLSTQRLFRLPEVERCCLSNDDPSQTFFALILSHLIKYSRRLDTPYPTFMTFQSCPAAAIFSVALTLLTRITKFPLIQPVPTS